MTDLDDTAPGWLARLRNAPPVETRTPAGTAEPAPARPPRPLAQEAAVEPDVAILDAQHHLNEDHFTMDDALTAVADSGHRVIGTIFVEAQFRYRSDGPEELRSVGEVEAVRADAERTDEAWAGVGIARGIVGHADLLLGERVVPVLEALIEAGGGRLVGIRDVVAFDPDARFRFPPPDGAPEGMMADPRFRKGLDQLKRFGLVFNVSLFDPQLPELVDLVRNHPEQTFVLDHVGLPLYIHRPDRPKDTAMKEWRKAMADLAALPNTAVKIGNLPRLGGIMRQPQGPGSDQLAEVWKQFVDAAVQAFGPHRSMLESDITIQAAVCTYTVLWNALKKATSDYNANERERLFHGTTEEIYGL